MIAVRGAAATFFADLARAVTIPHDVDYVAVNRHGDGDGIVLDSDLATPSKAGTSSWSTIRSTPVSRCSTS